MASWMNSKSSYPIILYSFPYNNDANNCMLNAVHSFSTYGHPVTNMPYSGNTVWHVLTLGGSSYHTQLAADWSSTFYIRSKAENWLQWAQIK